MTDLLADFQRFVTDEQNSAAFAAWARDNHGPKNDPNFSIAHPKPGSELAAWYSFRDAIVGGLRPPPPLLQTAYGKGLIDAGVLYLDATAPVVPPPPALRVTVTGTPTVGQQLQAAIA